MALSRLARRVDCPLTQGENSEILRSATACFKFLPTLGDRGYRARSAHENDRRHHHAGRRRRIQQRRDRRTLWFQVEFGTRYPQHQVQLEPRSHPLQVAGDGPMRIMDDDPGVQSDPHHECRRGVAARQATAANQFHRRLPVRAGVVNAIIERLDRPESHRLVS